ncbi:MAG: Xaa-Pro peptidase family protein [Planctomycetota bacterium]|nr:Xaa-Pro peptidase family protein [Planctomycetota bacterium]
MSQPFIAAEEFAQRRTDALAQLDGAMGLVFAGTGGGLEEDFRPHLHFEYLTGITDEPGAILLLDPSSTRETHKQVLILQPHLPEVEKWDGWRGTINASLREKFGFKTIIRSSSFPNFVLQACKRSKKAVCLHPLVNHESPVGPDLEIFQKLQQRIPGLEIVDGNKIIPRLRAVKSDSELAMIRRSAEITEEGFRAVLATLRPGISEFDVQEAAEHGYRSNGSRGPFYGTIVGAGFNGTILHYRANDQIIGEQDLVVIDSGARFGEGSGGYGSDVTRTYPASGVFTDRQKEIYQIVLDSMETTIAAVKAGVEYSKLDDISRKVITDAGYGDFYPHGVGHPIGLEVHDVQPDPTAPQGAVITIEPGIYLPDEGFGIRIEDDILVTADGPVNLTGGIPKTIEEIESAMANYQT